MKNLVNYKKTMTEVEFYSFIRESSLNIRKNCNYDYSFYWHLEEGIISVCNMHTKIAGIVFCDKDNISSVDHGVVLAYCRLEGISFPNVIEEIEE